MECNRYGKNCIIQCKNSENIIKSASNMRIKSIVLSEDMTSKTLKDVLDSAKDYKSGDDIFIMKLRLA